MTNDASRARPRSIYLVAAEESGDALGAALARALRERVGAGLKLSGIGGAAMAEAGVASLFPIHDLSIIGLTAIPQKLPTILRRIREAASDIVSARPDALVIIDSPDFTHRVARRVRELAPAIPIIDYVSPSVWFWRPWRARSMRAYVDCVLAILPFEPAAHLRLGGPPCLYVGHPAMERLGELRPNKEEALARRSDPPAVLVLPGSRTSEIRRLLATFGAAIAGFAERIGPMELVLPTLPHLLARVRERTSSWAIKPRIVVDPAEKWAAFRRARVALAASGTVTLELALSGVPTVAAYRVARIEELFLRSMGLQTATVSSVILANLVIGENVVPEFLQQDCNAAQLADALVRVASDTPERRRQVEAFARLDRIMKLDSRPSVEAATAVLDIARRGRRLPA